MKVKLTYILAIVILSLAGMAFANEINDINEKGSALDFYTFPDGTVVRTSIVNTGLATSQPVIQIKTASGKECYGFAHGTGAASIACP